MKFSLQNDKNRIYEIKAIVLNKMTSGMILGMDFLLSNDAIINLNECTINIDGKYYELNIGNVTDNEIKTLTRKTKINAIVEQENDLRKKINGLIKNSKIANPEIGNKHSGT